MRFVSSFLVLLSFITLLASCGTRGPNSRFVPPPIDPIEDNLIERFKQLNIAAMQIPERTEYVIGPGDILSLSFVDPEVLNQSDDEEIITGLEIPVTQDPGITLPYVGWIKAHGKTAAQLQEDIRVAFDEFTIDPQPILRIEKYYQNQFTILGTVREPGRYELEVGDTVLDAVFKAGGLTFGGRSDGLPPASTLKVYRQKIPQKERLELSPQELINRLTDDGETVLPRDEIILPLDEFIIGGDLTYNIILEPEDVIYIPPAGTVNVQGPVRSPRVVFLGPSLRTLSQVMNEVGGLRYKAAHRVEVVRTNADGTQESFFVHAKNIKERKEPDFALKDNDQVFVYEHPVRAVLGVVGDIFSTTISTGVNATYSPVP